MRSTSGRLGLGLFFLLSILPIAAGLVYALLYSLGGTGQLATGWTLESWRAVLGAREVRASLGLVERAGELPELVQDPWAIGIVLTHTFLAVPYLALLFTRLGVGERLEGLAQLAVSLGATPFQVLYRVQLPVLLRAAASNLVLLFVLVFGSYEIPLLLGRQSPQMISVLTLRKYALFDLSEKPEAFALALLYTAWVLALLTWLVRREARGRGH